MTYLRNPYNPLMWESDGNYNGKFQADDGTFHDSANDAVKHTEQMRQPPVAPGEQPPHAEVQSRSVLKRKALQCGEPIPRFDAARPSQPETEGDIGRQPDFAQSPSEQPPELTGDEKEEIFRYQPLDLHKGLLLQAVMRIKAATAKLAREGALESISEITKRWHAEAMKLLDKTKNATDRVEQLTLRKCAEQIDDAIRLAAQPSPSDREEGKK